MPPKRQHPPSAEEIAGKKARKAESDRRRRSTFSQQQRDDEAARKRNQRQNITEEQRQQQRDTDAERHRVLRQHQGGRLGRKHWILQRLPEIGVDMEEGGSADVPQKGSSEVMSSSSILVAEEPVRTSTADQRKPGGTSGIRCPYCRYLCGSRFSFQIHVGSRHPLLCDSVPVGRLGKVVFYQPTAGLFHCHICFFTSKDYAVVFQHVLARHCPIKPTEQLSRAEPEEENPLKRKRSSTSESEEEERKRTGEDQHHGHRVHPHHTAQLHQCPYCSFQGSLRQLTDHLTHCRVQEETQEQ